MPKIRELAGLKDGFFGRVVDSQGEVHGAPGIDVLAYINERAQVPHIAFEHFLEGFFSIPDCVLRVHCFSTKPLKLAFCVSRDDQMPEEGWWEH